MYNENDSFTPSVSSDAGSNPEARFPLGMHLATSGVLEAVPQLDIMLALSRHVRGDWGEVCPEDKAENDFALDRYLRILSAYTAENGTRFWIITEADRATTTVVSIDFAGSGLATVASNGQS
jgi:hypothetical protein